MAEQTANQFVADEVTTHTVNLLRVASKLRQPVLAELERLETSLVGEIAKLPDDPTSNKAARLTALLAQTKGTITEAYQTIQDNQGKALSQIAAAEQAKTNAVVNGAIGVTVMSVAQTPEQLETLSSKLILEGKLPKQWWATQSADLQDSFATAMRDGVHRGEGIDALVRRVRGTKEKNFTDGIMAISKSRAETLVRTSVQTVANQARLLSFEKNLDVIKGVQWRSTLDDRTSKICMALDGLVWSLPDYIPVDHDKPFPGPIAHFNCRSVQVSVMRSWDELSGPNAVKPPAGPPAPIDDLLRKKLLAAGFSADKVEAIVKEKRGAVNGEPAPPVRFQDWLAGKSHDFQNKLLGPQRAQLWRENAITLKDLIGKDLEPLTIQELHQMIAKGQSVQANPPVEGQNKMSLLDRKLLQESMVAGLQHGEVMTHFVDLENGLRVSIKGTSPSVDDLAQVQGFKKLGVIRNVLANGDVFSPQEINLFGKLDAFHQARIVNPAGRVMTITVKNGQTFEAVDARQVNALNSALQETKAVPSLIHKLSKAIRDHGSLAVRVDPVGTIIVPPGTYNQTFPTVAKPAPFFDPEKIAQQKAAEAARLQAAKMKAEAEAEANAAAAAAATKEAARQEAAQLRLEDAEKKTDHLSVAMWALWERKQGTMQPTEIIAAAQAQVAAEQEAKKQAAEAKLKAEQEAAEKKAAAEAAAKKAAEEAAAKLAAEKQKAQDAAAARIEAEHRKGGALSNAIAEINAGLQIGGKNPGDIDQVRLLSDAKDKVIADKLAAEKAAAAAEAAKQQAAKEKIDAIFASKRPQDQELQDIMFSIDPKAAMGMAKNDGTQSTKPADLLQQATEEYAKQQAAKAAAAAEALAKEQTAIEAYKKASKGTLETFELGKPSTTEINGVPFSAVPTEYWKNVADVKLANEPAAPDKKTLGKREFSTGVIFVEKDGSLWMYQPTDDPATGKPFAGYNNTFSKGRAEANLSHQQNALKEAYEELGLQGQIKGYLGDFKGSSTLTRFYVGERTGGEPWNFGEETAFVKRVTPEQAKKLFNVKRDRDITDALQAYLNPPTQSTGPAVNLADLKFVKILPGSTQPSLMQDQAGTQYVLKREPNNPGHVREEFHVNEVYRTLGIDVPKQQLVEETAGPALLSDFIPNGIEYGKWKQTATAAQIAAVKQQLRSGFVADALLANYDVIGTGDNNIFITTGGRVVRLDNGGGLRYRAQGGLKPKFTGVVSELDSMRDPRINSYAADVFRGITDAEVHQQIQFVLANREKIIAALPDDSALRDLMNARIDDLAKRLPAALQQTSQSYTQANAEAVLSAKANGHSLAGDRDLIETNGQLFWKETTASGQQVTKAEVYLSKEGSAAMYRAIEGSLQATERAKAIGATLAAPVTATPTATAYNGAQTNDPYFTSFLSAAKTVNFHLKDGKFNFGSIDAALASKSSLEQKLKSGTAEEKQMAAHYLSLVPALEKAKAGQGETIPALNPFKFTAPVVEATPATAPTPAPAGFTVKVVPLEFEEKKFVEGNLVSTGRTNYTVGRYGTGTSTTYEIAVGDTTIRFTPFLDGNVTSYALQGRIEVTTAGVPSLATLEKTSAALRALGIENQPASKEWLELAYLKRGFFSMKQETSAAYTAIVNDAAATDAEKIERLKSLAKVQGVQEKYLSGSTYNPAGQMMNPRDANGHTIFERWDLPRAEVEKQMAGYALRHTTSRDMKDVVDSFFASGGETTPTVQRLRKGISINAGMSPDADIGTGGANYWFTRIRKVESKEEGFYFKIGNIARQDAISYTGDRFGKTSDPTILAGRITTVAEYKKAASVQASDETILRFGVDLASEIDVIKVRGKASRDAIISTFKQNGFAILPDGRKIEDAVIAL